MYDNCKSRPEKILQKSSKLIFPAPIPSPKKKREENNKKLRNFSAQNFCCYSEAAQGSARILVQLH